MSVTQVTDSYVWYYIPSKKARDLTFRRHPGSVSGVTVRLPLSWSTVHPLFLLFWADSFILKKLHAHINFGGYSSGLQKTNKGCNIIFMMLCCLLENIYHLSQKTLIAYAVHFHSTQNFLNHPTSSWAKKMPLTIQPKQ